MQVEVIRTTGQRETHEIQKHGAIRACNRLIGADCCDVVSLRDGRVMMVDDTGLVDGKAVNIEATQLYHAVCRPGTTHPICGDVVIANDADFE